MTEQEALALKPGDRVEAKYGCNWHVVRVVSVEKYTPAVLNSFRAYGYTPIAIPDSLRYVLVRKVGITAQDRMYGEVTRRHYYLRHLTDPVPAQIYADWLEENDFPEAAAALRKRFPFATGTGEA